jgi:hypothetical protein
VYRPLLLTLPTAGLRDHVTEEVLGSTSAVNCCVCEIVRDTLPGETLGTSHVIVRLTLLTWAHSSNGGSPPA